MRALALDPGKTTGWAVAALNHGVNLDVEVGETAFTLDGLYEFLDDFINTGAYQPMHVIYEDFSYRNASRAGLDLTPVKMIGIIELFRDRFEPNIGFHLQSASTGKAFWSDPKLKEANIYAKGRKHGRDATRHLMQWMAFGPGSRYGYVNAMNMSLEIV